MLIKDIIRLMDSTVWSQLMEWTKEIHTIEDCKKGQISDIRLYGLTATNLVKNGNFVKDSDSNGIADFWRAGGSNFTNPRIENNTQYWMPLLPNKFSSSLHTDFYFPNIYGHKYYIKAKTKNIGMVYWWGEAAQSISTTGIPAKGLIFTSNCQGTTRLVFYVSEANVESYVSNVILVDLTAHGLEDKTVDELDAMFSHYFDGTKSTVGALRIRSVSEDETQESSAYVIATDADTGEILELRSLPNGTKDEISFNQQTGQWEHTQAVSGEVRLNDEDWAYEKIYNGLPSFYFLNNGKYDWQVMNTTTTSQKCQVWLGENILHNFAISPTTSHWVVPSSLNFNIRLTFESLGHTEASFTALNNTQKVDAFKSYLAANPLTLIYQLAEPVEIPIEVSGNIVSYPSGTIYIEHAVPDAGIYTDKMSVLHQDLPIKALEKLSKIDFMTGLETELDVSDAVIAEDKLSFTHPDLVDGDIVFFVYEYDRESTEGETEIEYYDSRYVIKDSVTGKFYKWHIAVAEGVPSIELVEV